MIEIDVCVPIIAAIIGIGYPILLQAVTNLEDKYNSNVIVELFKREPERKFLTFSIIASLLSALLVLLNRPPWFDFGILNIIVDNSAVLLLILFTIVLVIAFFLFIRIVLIYNSKHRFIKYLIHKHSNPKRQSTIFKAISEILYYSIRSQEIELAHKISEFLYKAFSKQRELIIDKPVEYPIEYYELTYKTTEELAQIGGNKLLFLEARSGGAIWLLGEFNKSEISETTYRWLWGNLLLPIRYERDNMVVSFWEVANQHFNYNLQIIDTAYHEDGQISNSDSIEKREQERNRFLEFTHALGGLLLYKKKYSIIYRFFRFTSSIPPRYELLPNSMKQVVELYLKFYDPYENKFPFITHKYYFPDLEGLNADYTVKKWICAYVGVLFLRQYTLIPHYIYDKPLDFPSIPQTARDKRMWIDNLGYLKDLVKETLSNELLLETLNLRFISKEWCDNSKVPFPTDFIEEIITRVKNEYEKQKEEQELSEAKIDNFYNAIKRIIPPAFQTYVPLNNGQEIKEDYKQLFIMGEYILFDKSSYATDQETETLNYDSFLPDALSSKIHRGMSEIFHSMKTKTYLFQAKDIFTAIDRLDVNSEEHIILNFGNYLPHFINDIKVPDLSIEEYKKIKIFTFKQFNYQLIGESFFILRKTDLPNIEYLEIDKEIIDKFQLKLLSAEHKLYGSVLDLFKHKDLQKDYLENSSQSEINKSALLYIAFSNRIRWRDKIKVVQIRSHSRVFTKGSTNDLKDIIPFQEK